MIEGVVLETAERASLWSQGARWAACAAIWARLWVEAGHGLKRWPHEAMRLSEALTCAMWKAAGTQLTDAADLVLVGLEAIEIDDDGSADWQSVVDLASMLIDALTDNDETAVLERTVRAYLEGAFNVLANDAATEAGGVLSQAVAETVVAQDERWQRTLSFVRGL